MALTQEQLQQMVQRSKTRQQATIQQTEKKQGQGGLANFFGKGLESGLNVAKGIGKGVVSTFTGASSLGERGLQSIFGDSKSQLSSAEQLIPENLRKPEGTAQKIGFGAEQIGEFFIPASASLKVGKAASLASKARGAGIIGQTASKLGTIGLTEGVLGTGQSALQSGNLGKSELGVGAISLVAPVALAGAGKVLTKFAPKSLQSKIINGIKSSIKPSMSSTKNPGYMDAATRGLQVIKNDIKASGNQIPQTVEETLSALKRAKVNIYNRYNDIATQSGELGARFNPSKIMADLSNWGKSKGYSSEIKEYAAKRLQQLADLKDASPAQVQDRIEELNSGIKFFTSGSEKLKNQIDASIAARLRSSLDEVIINTTGQPYQAIRSDYAALKTIEDDIARTAGNLARRGAKGFFDLTDIFTGGDIATGVLTGNPTSFIRGIAGKSIKDYIKYINNPNTQLKKVFELIDRLPEPKRPVVPTQKLLPSGIPGRVEDNVPIPLGARSQSTIDAEELMRLKGKGAVTPKTALRGLEQEARKYKTAEEFVKSKTFFRGEDPTAPKSSGNYFTKDKEFANEFAGGTKLKEASVLESDIYRAKKLPEAVNEKQVTEAIVKAKLEGKKAIYVDEGSPFGEPVESLFVFDKSAIKTKSQLTDIWNKANKK